jgi:hypothetical protein
LVSGAAAAEAATIMGASPTLPLPLVNRQESWLSETDGRVGDREH